MKALSFGGGTDSTAILCGWVERGLEPFDLILFADTGGERPHTYEHIERMQEWLRKHGMPPITIVRKVRRDGRIHTLEDNCIESNMLPSLAYGFKGCSQKFKIAPQDKFMNNYAPAKAIWKAGEKVDKFIGYEFSETRRWMKAPVEDEKYRYHYPLVEWEWSRPECLAAIDRAGLPRPGKSSCFFCPASKKSEIAALKQEYPVLFQRALAMEANAKLTTVRGLGRRFSWRDYDTTLEEPDVVPCISCADGSNSECEIKNARVVAGVKEERVMEQVDVSTFVKFLSGLAPEDETLLLTRQTPRMANGQVQFHPDGAVKATFPAFLPGTKKIKPGESWFANTASFIVDRFKDGKPSASSANCEFCLVLMLDDIGTKSKTPPLEPTWKMETSPGNFQWGYAFTTDQPKKAEFAAAVRAMAEAGYTDPGACNPVRNFRIPGSVNIKPDREGFAARLVEFHPEREFTLPQICEALGVTPGEAESVGPRSLRLADDGNDDVAAWLSAQGYVYSRPNPEGWMGVHCPQADQHTDGNPESRYNPSMRAWCCMHSHCVDRDSAWFLRWVQEQGGPSHTPGLREELMVSAISSAMSQITPTDAFPDEAARVVAEVERKEAGRIEREGWFERYAYLEQDDGYFDLVDRRAHSRRTFDALYRHVACHSIHVNVNAKPRRIEASTFFDENRVNMGARSVIGMTYAAGETVLCAHEGGVYANRWRNTRPSVRPGGDPTPWLRHIERLIPDERDRNHVLDVMAFKLQHPERKVNHAILFGSTTHGVGKDLSFKPFFWAIGDSNVKQLKNEQLHTQWGYHLECEVLHINELRQPESVDRRALENKLKPIIAAPPDMLTVERKGAHPYSILNRLLVVAMTNNRDAISIGTDDRRWFVVWSDAPQMNTLEDPDAGKRFSDWLDAGGNEAVAAWLYARDVSAFNPGATPPMTDAKRLMIGAARSMAEAWLIEQIDARASEFARGVVAGPWQGVCDRLQGMAPPGSRIVPPALLHALREAGWTDLGLCHSRAYKAKRHVFAHPGFAGTKSEARELVETPATGLRLA